MGRIIFITEKPSVAQEYRKVLNVHSGEKTDGYIEGHSATMNKDVIITWAVGHLIALGNVDEQIEHRPLSKMEYEKVKRKWADIDLPVIPQEYIYIPNGATYKQFKTVKDLYTRKDIDAIYYAGDSGREGIYIQALIRNQIFKSAPKLDERVVWIDSFTEEAILKGIKEAKPYRHYQPMIDSGYARAISDWLIGMNGTMAFTLTSHTLITVGRVMSPTLAMVVDRQNEIDNFTKTSFYGVKANDTAYWKGDKKSRLYDFDVDFYNENGFLKQEKANGLIDILNGDKSLKVETATSTRKKEYAPLLFNLADLQNHCSKKYHINPTQTLEIAQSLYEKKVTTYPRTDARVLSSAVAKEYREKFGHNIPSRYVDDSKITDHYAIVPTFYKVSLSGLEEQVYNDILNRYMNIMKPAHEYDTISVVYLHSCGERFYESWKKVMVQGWKDFYDEDEADRMIPTEGSTIPVPSFAIREMETKPPTYYTSGSLIMAMEKSGRHIEDEELREQIKTCGIGTSATRANIIEKLAEKNFITINSKTQRIEATEIGKKIVPVIKKFDESLTSPIKTAELEQKLSDVASGSMTKAGFLAEVNTYIKDMTNRVLKDNHENLGNFNGTKGDVKEYNCPCCGKPMKFGKFGYYCDSKADGCGFNLPKDYWGTKLTEKDFEGIVNKGQSTKKKLKSKDGNPYYAYLIVDKAGKKLIKKYDNDGSKSSLSSKTSKPKSNSNIAW